ncbi:MAG: hypothetical protein AAGH87_03800 [Pseudomonadota bacterium]
MTAPVADLAAAMVAALEETAMEASGGAVTLVSVTLDVTGPVGGGGDTPPVFEAAIDRKTRSLIFLNARAMAGAGPVMTGTAIFSLTP